MIVSLRRGTPGAARSAALGLMLLLTSCGGVEVHRDGEGPVVSFDDPEGSSRMAIDPQPGVDSWSYGMPLCLEDGQSAATLQEVTPSDTVGSGFAFLGALIHDYDAESGQTGIISADGYPPPGLETLVPVDGYQLTVDCELGQGDEAELIVGLEMTGPDGGGWLGADLAYRIGDRDYVLQIRNEMLICGESVVEVCQGPPDSESP